MLIRSVTWVVREPVAAALLVATTATFFLFWRIQELTALEVPGREATGLMLFAAFPSAFILIAEYPDSLLIALAVWSVYCGGQRELWRPWRFY